MRAWEIQTDEDLARSVHPGVTTESLFLDFKKALDQGPDWQAEVARDVAQFANARAGCLLLGVRERKDLRNIKIAEEFVGVLDPDRCRESIEQAIHRSLVPSDLSRTIAFVHPATEPQTTLVAVNVFPSRRLVWVSPCSDGNRLDVVTRTNHGKAYMRPGEIEMQWANSLRSAQIAFGEALDVIAAARPNMAIDVEIVGGVARVSRHGVTLLPSTVTPSLGNRRDAYSFDVRIPIGDDIATLKVPFEMLSSAWVDGDSVLHILLRVPLVWDVSSKVLRFDPFGLLSRPSPVAPP